ncbi:L10-interacting MYB domain-containing protein-like [Senna tora]|uniref:L10-interacting MYB domain-containing protein-like n=1 Tax=Senna tora TaxID=362788 RepID=A0A834TIJ2_9FABA|nr:L10-interacting MYB domain-containing protein-like [Senna tora]
MPDIDRELFYACVSKCLSITSDDLFKNGLSVFGWNPTLKMWTVEPDVWEKLMENGLSGFGWNPTSKMWTVEPDVWEKLIEKEQVLLQPSADPEALVFPSEEAS